MKSKLTITVGPYRVGDGVVRYWAQLREDQADGYGRTKEEALGYLMFDLIAAYGGNLPSIELLHREDVLVYPS